MLASLEAANGNGTSMITLLLPPRFQLSRAAAKLTEELGTASNIKKTANRNSVKEAIVSAQQKLKLYQETPPNGLCVFVGTVFGGSKVFVLLTKSVLVQKNSDRVETDSIFFSTPCLGRVFVYTVFV